MKVRASTDWKMRNLPILASLLVKSISLKMFNSVMMMMIIMISMMEVSDSSCPPLLYSYRVCYNGQMLTVCCRNNIFLLSSICLTIGVLLCCVNWTGVNTVFSNAHRILSQCNTQLRLLYLLSINHIYKWWLFSFCSVIVQIS